MPDYHRDPANGRTWCMWEDAGLRFRSNLIERVGGTIPLHRHSYDHVAFIEGGHFRCELNGRAFEVAAPDMGLDLPRRVTVAAEHEHLFTLLATNGRPGEVLCVSGKEW